MIRTRDTHPAPRRTPRPLAALALALIGASSASAQVRRVTFSIDWHGPTIGVADTNLSSPITEADILTAVSGDPRYGPLAAPAIVVTGGDLGIPGYPACQGHMPGTACAIELDALSYGFDALLTPQNQVRSRFWFTVDEYAVGIPNPGAPGPTVRSEFLAADLSSDIWIDLGLPPGPLAPNVAGGHAAVVDGDGNVSASGFRYPGVGVIEPNSPGTVLPNNGDNVDAFDVGPQPSAAGGRVYFSLDAGFADPLAGASNAGSATSAGQFGAAVLVSQLPAGTINLYAPPGALGLNQLAELDDLDALILRENGQVGYQRSLVPYDWMAGTTDMLVFSVRRGSAVIGSPDSIFGLPIEEGDLLVPPVAGGMSPFPGIFIAAEALGLRTTRQSPMAANGDDLNGGDATFGTWNDCNDNGIEDSVDIATGASSDNNMNGVPDECEQAGEAYCTCPEGLGPCGNDDASAGCATSTGAGCQLAGSGSSSVSSDDLVLTASGVPPDQFGLYFMGDAQTMLQFGDGHSCIAAGPLGVHRFPVQNSGPTGVMVRGPGVVGDSCELFPPAGCIAAATTWNFQCWFRDPTGPCGGQWNYSNAWSVTFTP